MSDHSFAINDPFEPTVPDEETELRALARALRFADGFTLLFVRCYQHDQRQRLVAALRRELPQFNVLEMHFHTPIDHLLKELRKELRKRLTQPSSDAVFVSGLEYSLPKAADAHTTPFVANLNAARNSFPLVVPCPLVLWVPEYVLTAIMRGAPDFFSIRSGVYFFVATPQETADLARSLTAGAEWTAANLPFTEKQERIAAVESLLANYQALPPAHCDRRAEARLLVRLGTLYFALGQWTEAEAVYQQSLAICRELGDRVNEGTTLSNLGTVYQYQGRWAEAEATLQQSLAIRQGLGNRLGEGQTLSNLGSVYYRQGRWAEAEATFQQSLDILREFGDRDGEGTTLMNLGLVYFRQGRWAEAEVMLQQSLAIRQRLGDYTGEGTILSNLGLVYHRQGRWAEAEATFQQSLDLLREFGDRVAEAQTLNNLGNVYRQRGRWMKAEMVYQQSSAIFHEVGDRVNEGQTLANLGLLRETQGDLTGALEFGRQAVAALETTEDEAAKEEVRRLVAEWERNNR